MTAITAILLPHLGQAKTSSWYTLASSRAQAFLLARGMWRVSWAMKSKAEKCFSLPLKYPEAQDFYVTVSCSSSPWIFSS